MLRTERTVMFDEAGWVRPFYCWHCGKYGSDLFWTRGRCGDCLPLDVHEGAPIFCSGCGGSYDKPVDTQGVRPNHAQTFHCAKCTVRYGGHRTPEPDAVNHPPHYTSHPSGVECVTVAEHFGFNLGNALKYLWRADAKGAPIEDLRKAVWYINREIEKRTKGGAT